VWWLLSDLERSDGEKDKRGTSLTMASVSSAYAVSVPTSRLRLRAGGLL
jgi:hypothetical protein